MGTPLQDASGQLQCDSSGVLSCFPFVFFSVLVVVCSCMSVCVHACE